MEKNVDFDTFDVHVMVNYIEPHLQEIIFRPTRVGLITQKQFWDLLKNCHFWGQTPYYEGFKALFLTLEIHGEMSNCSNTSRS